MSNAMKFLLLAASVAVVALVTTMEMSHIRSSKTVTGDLTAKAVDAISEESNHDYTVYNGSTIKGSEVWMMINKYSGDPVIIEVMNEDESVVFSDFSHSHDQYNSDGSLNDFYISSQDSYMCVMEKDQSGVLTSITFKKK